MDYFCREDMKMTPPDSLNQKQANQWLSYGFKRDEIVQIDENVSDFENKKLRFQKNIKDNFKRRSYCYGISIGS